MYFNTRSNESVFQFNLHQSWQEKKRQLRSKGCRFSRFPAVISTKHEPVLGFVAERSREAQRESFSAPLRMVITALWVSVLRLSSAVFFCCPQIVRHDQNCVSFFVRVCFDCMFFVYLEFFSVIACCSIGSLTEQMWKKATFIWFYHFMLLTLII